MGIRISRADRSEFKRLYTEAVELQVKLFDKLGEIEKLESVGMLTGLDDYVRDEASNFTDIVTITDLDVSAVLQNVERDREL